MRARAHDRHIALMPLALEKVQVADRSPPSIGLTPRMSWTVPYAFYTILPMKIGDG